MDYINEICPVCRQPFSDTDDVVVCPDCGTPHHRACWQRTDACANAHLHADGFVWQKSVQPVPPVSGQPQPQPAPQPVLQQNGAAPLPPILPMTPAAQAEDESLEQMLLNGCSADPDELIDGVRAGDLALYIQQNARGYVKKFLKRKVTFNWAALIFSPAWFFYRKMYKAGAIFLSIFVALALFTAPLAQTLNTQSQAFEDEINKITQETGENSYNAILSKAMEDEAFLAKYRSFAGKYMLYFALNTAIPGLLSALLANYIYFKKMKKDIAAIKEEAKSEDRRFERALILNKGGVSILWGLVVLFGASYLPDLLISAGKFLGSLF